MSDLPPPPPAPLVSPPPDLPSPPPVVGANSPPEHRHARRGELCGGWKTVFVAAWAGVILGLASVWKTARTVGLSTWWLGSSSDPRLIIVQLAPFAVPVALLIAAWKQARWLPAWGVLGAVTLGAVAAGDLAGFSRLSLVEFVIAAAALAVSIATASGLVRRQ